MKGGCLVVIPARLASTRLPRKVLADLRGRPMIEWCWRAARAARLGPVLVATDHERVARAVRGFGGEARLVKRRCQSGTDRVFHAVGGVAKAAIVINYQGDLPIPPSGALQTVAGILRRRPEADIATLVAPLSPARAADPNVVKAALSRDGRALYFSRAPIPFPRGGRPRYYEHVGIYGYRRESLRRFTSLPRSPLERLESLEQLRALESGMTIYAGLVPDAGVAVDTRADLRRAELALAARLRRYQR